MTTLAFSPDSSQFAFAQYSDRGARLYIIGADGSKLRETGWSGTEAAFGLWSPDATAFYLPLKGSREVMGVMGVVLTGGEVRPGDPIAVELPEGPARPLVPV